MRLCIVGNTDLPPRWVGDMLGSLQPSFARVLRPDTEVVFKPSKGALRGDSYLDFDQPYFSFLNEARIVETFIEASREGFDAALVNCFGDPGVRVARHAVDMPIIGPGEAALHFACQIGRKMAIIVPRLPGMRSQTEDQLRLHGLESRLISNGIRCEPEPFEVAFARGQKDPGYTVEAVSEVARGCVADGADVIVIACCGTGPLLSRAGFNRLVVDGQQVPVIDAMMVAAKMAETVADIRKGAGLPIPSRTRSHALPSEADWKRVRTLFGLPV